MEIEQLENGKKLQDNLNKCRCCFRMVIDANRAVSIDENIRHQFFCLTGIEVSDFNLPIIPFSRFRI